MKRKIKKIAAALLAVAILLAPAYAYNMGEVVPGDYVDINYTEFFDSSGLIIDPGIDFSDKNFTIAKKTISRGANLVKSITINNRADTVRITFADRAGEAPKSPNVVITDLALRATKTLRDGSIIVIKSGTLFKYGNTPLEFQVGNTTQERSMLQDGDSIMLQPGDKEFVKWVRGDGYGNVTVEYGSQAILTGRVYEGDRVLYSYDDTVPETILDRNPNAYLRAVNIKGTQLPNNPTLMILAEPDEYVYVNDNGTLREAGLRWDKNEYAWKGKVNTGKSYIISDSKLRSVAAGSGSSSYEDDSSSSSENPKPDNPYFNPNTGGGGGTAVAISAVVAILAIAIVSVIMSTIVSVKSSRNK